MKFLPTIFLGIGLTFILFFFYKTFTINQRCGWKDLPVGKEWPCRCLGYKSTSRSSYMNNNGYIKSDIYYCTGLNLSCSEFILSLQNGNYLQHPNSCF